jgi:hypothetical protein
VTLDDAGPRHVYDLKVPVGSAWLVNLRLTETTSKRAGLAQGH